MRTKLFSVGGLVLVLLAVIVTRQVLFTVNETDQVIITQFGEYKRTIRQPAIRRALINVGWQGEIEETFRSALRLNKRSVITRAKLPGELYSLGVYRIESRNIVFED